MISVCMATYNGARFIKEQVDSILPQLGADDELVVSDDGSTDGTLEILMEYAAVDLRVKVLHHQHNPAYEKIKHSRSFYYATANFENALKEARGDYIFLSDQDDVWAKTKVNESIAELQNCDILMCDYSIIDGESKIITEKALGYKCISTSYMRNIMNPPFLGCIMAFKRNVLKSCIPFPKKLICHDLWIGCIGAKKFKFHILNKNLVMHRKHNLNVSMVGGKSNTPIFYKIGYRIRLYIQLLFFGVKK